jgi:hypothetical protein
VTPAERAKEVVEGSQAYIWATGGWSDFAELRQRVQAALEEVEAKYKDRIDLLEKALIAQQHCQDLDGAGSGPEIELIQMAAWGEADRLRSEALASIPEKVYPALYLEHHANKQK